MVTLVPQQGEKAVGASNVQPEPHSTVLFVAQLMAGGVVLTMVIVWLHVLELPQQSIATQVWVMNCGQSPLVTVRIGNSCTLVQQLSKATGTSNVQAWPHCTVLLVPQMITGGVVSTMVTVWLQVFELPQQSVATQVRVRICGQRPAPLVTVLSTITVTLEQQLSYA